MAAASKADARRLWGDAVTMADDTLDQMLSASWAVCEAYLPDAVVTDPGYTPASVDRYVLANVLHARDVWQAYRRDGDVVGFEQYAVRVRPLSDAVRSLLRPRSGVPGIG